MKKIITLLLLTLSVTIFAQEITFFHAYERYDYHLLEWQVNDQHNLAHYEIEQSFDGVNFTKYAMIGISEKPLYEFLVYQYRNGLNYYRLKVVNVGDSFHYSEIKTVNESKGIVKIQISPNPCTVGEIVTVNLNDKERKYAVFNILGRKVNFGKIDGEIRLMFKTPGIYLMLVETEKPRTLRLKVTD